MYSNGISFFVNTNTLISSFSSGEKRPVTLPDATIDYSTSEWALWGEDNSKPLRMRDDLKHCGVLNAGVISKVRMAIGQGPKPYFKTAEDNDGKETLEPVRDINILQWFERNRTYLHSYQNVYNLVGYGWGATQFILNKGRNKINRIAATDVFTARLGKKNKKGIIDQLYLCADWEGQTVFKEDIMDKVPLLQEGYEIEDLQAAIEKGSGYEYAMLHRIITDGTQYYPLAIWEAAQEWIKISRSVPGMKNAINKNQMTIKYIIFIDNGYWEKNYKNFSNLEEKEKEKIVSEKHQEINQWLTGELNAGKSIISGKWIDPYTKVENQDIKIEVIDDKWKDGKMLPDSAAADKQILFSMFLNPAIWGGNLLGDGASGGAGSGSDIREAFLVQLMMMHAERVMNSEVFTIVKYINGWDKLESDGKQLVFRYPSGILTTLDKGGSTKTTQQ